MTIWTCIRCGSPNGSITEMCFRCGAPRPGTLAPDAPPAPGGPGAAGAPGAAGGPASGAPGAGTDEPSLVPLARYDVLPPSGPPAADQPAVYTQPAEYQLPTYEPPTYQPPAYQPSHPPAAYPQPGPEPPAAHPPAGYPPPGHDPAAGYGQPAYPQPPNPARSGRWWVPVLIGVVVLLAIGAITTVVLVDRDADEPTGSPPTTSAPQNPSSTTGPSTPSTTQPTSASPTTPGSVGVVAINPAVTDSRAADVATMFDSHFTAVNAKDYATAIAVYDPAGVINPNDSAQVADFQNAISTTTDDQIMLRSIGPDPTGRGVLAARVTFRSNQHAGYGPRERPDETCTAWDVTYTLSRPGGSYKIFAGNAVNAPC